MIQSSRLGFAAIACLATIQKSSKFLQGRIWGYLSSTILALHSIFWKRLPIKLYLKSICYTCAIIRVRLEKETKWSSYLKMHPIVYRETIAINPLRVLVVLFFIRKCLHVNLRFLHSDWKRIVFGHGKRLC